MTDRKSKRRPCGACGKPVGTATIVCSIDGSPDEKSPKVPLCLACYRRYDLKELVTRIAQRHARIEATEDR